MLIKPSRFVLGQTNNEYLKICTDCQRKIDILYNYIYSQKEKKKIDMLYS